jgi:exosortase/archaeosortase family protein
MIKLNSLKNKIPFQIRLFLGKALLFFIVWKIVYGVLSFRSNTLDNILTLHVADASVWTLNNLTTMSGFSTSEEIANEFYGGDKIEYKSSSIYHNGYRVLNIADACNGLELIVLYIGFIVCMPSKVARKAYYIILGAIVIDAVNILRCVGLIYLREYYQVYFHFAHHYLFKIMVYSVTFLMWWYFSRKINLKQNEVVQV